MSRTVTLVLVDASGAVLGGLAPFAVEPPYWPEVADVVSGAMQRFGIEVAVLRLLTTQRPVPHGGAVTYLAEATMVPGGVVLEPVSHEVMALAVGDDPNRTAYARPGGPTQTLSWAASCVAKPFVAHQQRTWNLSTIWRLDRAGEPVWLKQVPRFFAHEPAVLEWLAAAGFGDLVPGLLAAAPDPAGGARMALRSVDGDDLYGAPGGVCALIAEQWHRIQAVAPAHLASLTAIGVPDRRGELLSEWIRRALTDHVAARPEAEPLLDALDSQLDALADCGLPETLVHGDLHPGNVRGRVDGPLVILDWGDCFIGHPAFDIIRLTEHLPEPDAATILDAWATRWHSTVLGCEPNRAVQLIRPILALRAAATYAEFVANIEVAEHPYHASDVDHYLDIAVRESARTEP